MLPILKIPRMKPSLHRLDLQLKQIRVRDKLKPLALEDLEDLEINPKNNWELKV